MRNIRLQLACVFQQVHRKKLLSEVASVELYIQDGLIEILQLPQGELFWQKAKAEGVFLDPFLQPLVAYVEDPAVVESHFGQGGHPMPVQLIVRDL